MSNAPHKWRLAVRLVIGLILASTLCQAQVPPEKTQDYKIAPNDLLDFRVFQEPELDAVVRVSGDGAASFALIGPVQVGGQTIGVAVEQIKARYRDGYLKNPQLSLTVRTYAKKPFTILGQVQRPGTYDMQGTNTITLLQAIGLAGGYTRIADASNVTIKRQEPLNKNDNIIKVNAKRMARGEDNTAFQIKPGDVITVGESLF